MESSPETSITQNFNPFPSTNPIQGMGATGLIYEPLLQFDLAAPPKYYPWLATGYKWGAGGKSITFTIRSGVKFNDGSPMTPADVVFSYKLVENNSTINDDGLPITNVTSSGNKVTVDFSAAQYTNLQSVAGVPILPDAAPWNGSGSPATFVVANPVGTGPYMLKSFSPEGYTLQKNPHYWQASKVKVPYVYFPVYTSNTSALDALYSGAIDWTGNFIPGLQKDFVDKSRQYHHFWEAAGSTNALIPNLHEWPTNQLAVRQAISAAINRDLVASEGEAGLENPQTNISGLTLPTFAAWDKNVKNMTVPGKGSIKTAEKILEKAGYVKKNGVFELHGKKVSVTIVDPSGYTDYAEDASIIAGELKRAGIDATFDGTSVNGWNADMADGHFQLALHWSNGGLTPYNLYANWLDSALSSGASAKAATGDYERLVNKSLDADLNRLSASGTLAQQIAAVTPLARYVATQLPVIPTTTASEWFEYNSQHFVGWPTKTNPYETGQPTGTNTNAGAGTDEVVVLHLSPR